MSSTALPMSRPALDQMMADVASEAQRRIEIRKVQARMARYATDPEAYAREVLGVEWWEKQVAIAMSVVMNKMTIAVAAFGVGKTHLAGGLANHYFDSYSDSIIISTAPTQDQVRDQLWKEIRNQRKTPPEPDVMRLTDPRNPSHFGVGRAPRDAQAMRGQHAEHLLVIMDEGAGVPTERWEAMGDLVVADTNRVLVIGNPTVSSGPYYEAAHSPAWNVIHISALEHPNILAALAGEPEPYPGAVSMGWLEGKLNDPRWCQYLGVPGTDEERESWKTEGAFEFPPTSDRWYHPYIEAEVKILGRFPSQAENAIWSMAWFDAAIERTTRDDVDTGQWLKWQGGDILCVGVDVARYGTDFTAQHVRRGPVSLFHQSWSQRGQNDSYGTMETAGRVLKNAEDIMSGFPDYDRPPRVEIRVDDAGLGGGVTDRLREKLAQSENWGVVAVNAQERAFEADKYPNLRSELWFMSAERAQSGLLNLSKIKEPELSELRRQLTATKWKMDSSSRRVAQDKDELRNPKTGIGRSPDDADAFNLAYMPVRTSSFRPEDMNALDKKSRWTGSQETTDTGWGPTGESRWRR